VEDNNSTDSSGNPLNPDVKVVALGDVVSDATSAEMPQFPSRPVGCSRPYSAASPWNLPVDGTPAYDAGSDAYIANLAGKGPITSNVDQYTYPVYHVDEQTPMTSVALDGLWSDVSSDNTVLTRSHPAAVLVPVPATLRPSNGSDGQAIIVDDQTGDEWGFWQLQQDPSGAWSATNGYHYNTQWSGVPPLSADGQPFGSRGAGVTYLAGLVTHCELDRGHIDHALAFAYDSPSSAFLYPASKSDGGGFGGVLGTDLPEGARLQLDPGLTIADLAAFGCTGPCLTVARAMQEYGMYVIDHSDHSKVMLEDRATAHWSGDIDSNTTRPIPVSRLKVVSAASQP
jgi:hypothetical protein